MTHKFFIPYEEDDKTLSYDDRLIRDSMIEEAKAICATCPVREPCLEWALYNLDNGIAGGMTETARRRYLRRMRRREQ